jgi:hypothetical protein
VRPTFAKTTTRSMVVVPAMALVSVFGFCASFTLAGCGTGSITDSGGSISAPGSGAAPTSRRPPVEPGGAKKPDEVFQGGSARGCDPSIDGVTGRTPLRRLTKREYDSTVRDVFGFELNPPASDGLPPDGSAGPFDANFQGSVVAATLERYRQSAERIASEVAQRIAAMVPCAGNGDESCARTFLEQYGSRAFRRPLGDEQIAALMNVYAAGAADATFREGIEYAVQAMVVSPSFMYHLEAKPQDGIAAAVPGYELAERLSYFIWGTIPDQQLMDAAAAGVLASEEGLVEQATRMVDDPKADARLDEFTEQWLNLTYLKSGHLNLPADRYPGFSPEYAQDALHEAKKFVAWVLRGSDGDGKLETLLTSTMSLPQGRSFEAYGMTPPPGYDGETPIAVAGRRAGVVAMPATMMGHAAEATSPIKRGVFVMHELVCTDIELPIGIEIPALGPPPPGVSIRQQLSQVTMEPQCKGCHGMINPIGFAFESYDRMGIERARDEFGAEVDDTGVLALADPTFDGPIQGAPALATRIFQSDSGRSCMLQQVFRFALGRLEAPEDTCGFAALAQQFEASNFDVRELMINVILQDSFRVHSGS